MDNAFSDNFAQMVLKAVTKPTLNSLALNLDAKYLSARQSFAIICNTVLGMLAFPIAPKEYRKKGLKRE